MQNSVIKTKVIAFLSFDQILRIDFSPKKYDLEYPFKPDLNPKISSLIFGIAEYFCLYINLIQI